MSNYLKYFREEFEKYAQDIGAPPPRPSRPGGGGKPGGGKPGTGVARAPTGGPSTMGGPPSRHRGGGGGGGAGYSTQGIKAMQDAIQDLAQTISNTIDYNALMKAMQGPPAPPVQPQAADREQQAQFKAEYGTDFFMNFMVDNYLKKADVHGVEYDTDPKRSKMLDKKPADLKAMFIILDSMKRIGAERKESFVDGNWGPRTNNALRNVDAIADAVLKLGGELGMQSQTFDVNKVVALGSMVPESDTAISLQDKLTRAPTIAAILKGVKSLFLDFKQQVLMDPVYRNFIQEKSPMFTAGPKKGVQATEGEQKILDDVKRLGYQSQFVRHPKAQFKVSLDRRILPTTTTSSESYVTVADLLSKESFEKWAMGWDHLKQVIQNNPQTWPTVAKSILDQVKAQITPQLGG